MPSQGRFILVALIGLCMPLAALAADAALPVAKLTATQILDKHIAARGGLPAWRGVQTMTWNGKMDVGYGDSVGRSTLYVRQSAQAKNAKKQIMAQQEAAAKLAAQKQVQLPFLLEMKRPSKSRLELVFNGQTAIQVYDGSSGWMKRPYLNRDDWEPYSPEQLKQAAGDPGLEGYLIDYTKQGTRVELQSEEPVESHEAYKLKLTLKNGDVRHVWIDAKSFLDVKVEGAPRRMDGRMHSVWVFQRDFRTVQGVTVPFELETAVDGYRDTHKMNIDKVAVNPSLDDALFARPKS